MILTWLKTGFQDSLSFTASFRTDYKTCIIYVMQNGRGMTTQENQLIWCFFFFLSIIYFFWKMNCLGIYKWENPGWVFQNVVDGGRAWSVIKGILWAPDSLGHELAMGETESRIEAKFRDERCPPSTTVTSQQWRKKYRIEKCLQHLLQVLARAYLDSLLDLAWPAAQRCHVPPGAKCSHKVLV